MNNKIQAILLYITFLLCNICLVITIVNFELLLSLLFLGILIYNVIELNNILIKIKMN